jgi:peptidoglycan/xylan/chitin deacetylase (PgdA/CDA1 family)
MNINKENLVYIYNLEQAYFYIREGLTPLYPPRENPNSKMVCFTFDKKESNPIYTKWLGKASKKVD